MRFLFNLVGLLAGLPWWGALAVLGALALFVVGSIWWFKWKFNQIVEEGVLNAGAALAGARVDVHSIKAVPAPKGPSPYDSKEDDEDFVEGLDCEDWNEPGVAFYELDATITPTDPDAEWSPDGVAPVPADWVGEEKTDLCERTGCVHTAHVFENGRWEFAEGDNVAGAHRVKLLFGFEPKGDRAIQLRNCVTPVGEPITLPAPHASFAPSAKVGR